MATSIAPSNNPSGSKGKSVGAAPPRNFAGKVGSQGGNLDKGKGKVVVAGNGGNRGKQTGPTGIERQKPLPRCKECVRTKKRCSLRENGVRPCGECIRRSRVCEYGPPVTRTTVSAYPPRRGQPIPRPPPSTGTYPDYQGNPFQPSAGAGPSSRQVPPRPAINPALYATQTTRPEAPAPPHPRAAPPARGDTHGLGSLLSRSSYTSSAQQRAPASTYQDRRDGRPPGAFPRTYSPFRRNPFRSDAQVPPTDQQAQRTTNTGYYGPPRPPSQASGMRMLGDFRGKNSTKSPPPPPPPPGPTFENTGIYQHATVNPLDLQLPPGQVQRDIAFDDYRSSIGRQVEQANIPQQEMQNASGTWGLNNQNSLPQAPSPLIGGPFDEGVHNVAFDNAFDNAYDNGELGQFLETAGMNVGMYDMDPNADFEFPQFGAAQFSPIQAPAAPATLPVSVDFSATRVRWRRRAETSSLAFVNPLELFPSNPTGGHIGPNDDLNRCSELVHVGDDQLQLCNKLSARRCEYGIGRPLNRGATHSRDVYYVCLTCHNEGQRLASAKRGHSRATRKLYTCGPCARGIIAARGTGIDDCECLEKVRTAWVCKGDIQKGYDAITNQSARVSNFLQREWQGEPCPICFQNSPDIDSGVFACKSCWYFVEEDDHARDVHG